jgi:hypothetical protein
VLTESGKGQRAAFTSSNVAFVDRRVSRGSLRLKVYCLTMSMVAVANSLLVRI